MVLSKDILSEIEGIAPMVSERASRRYSPHSEEGKIGEEDGSSQMSEAHDGTRSRRGYSERRDGTGKGKIIGLSVSKGQGTQGIETEEKKEKKSLGESPRVKIGQANCTNVGGVLGHTT